MTDGARAEITNAIWLCRNCHKCTDNDALAYPPDLLFSWRIEHEQYVAEKLGSRTEILRLQARENSLEGLFDGNSFAKQIAREKLPGWEYRLTAELLRSNLKKPIRRWSDLKNNLRAQKRKAINDEESLVWFQVKLAEAMDYMAPLSNLYSIELQKAWGAPGQSGNAEEIDRVCRLIGAIADELAGWEEEVRFSWFSSTYQPLAGLLQGAMGRQLEKLIIIPEVIDKGVDHAEAHPNEATRIEYALVIDFPEGWTKSVEAELKRIRIK
ncbi:hypothetical protein HUW63_06240 [Myxococcus sp. AM001]|nr:hypothetical protein [Myxococcus sp. AM001]